jgi:hypothetical protein
MFRTQESIIRETTLFHSCIYSHLTEDEPSGSKHVRTSIIIIIIDIQGWTIWPIPPPELQLLSPTFLWSSNFSPSLWSVVI